MQNHLKYNPKLKERAKELRKNSTLSEVLLWREINRKKLGVDFHRQKPIGNYIVDFYCPKLKLVIEIDGMSHSGKMAYDQKRDNYLKQIGLSVIHFSDDDIKQNLNSVLEYLKECIKKQKNITHPPPATTGAPLSRRDLTHPPAKAVPLSRGDSHTPLLQLLEYPSQEGKFRQEERIYQGVKFQTIFLQKAAPIHDKIAELEKWCHIFHQKNLAPPYPGGSFGNLSFRTENDTFIITGSRIGLKCDLTNDCFVEIIECDFENKKIKVIGTREPSSETMLHAALYQKHQKVMAVFHGHSPELLQNSFKLKIPETKEEKPYGTMELVESVLEMIDENKLIMMKNHGFIAVGKSMREAGNLVLEYLSRSRICENSEKLSSTNSCI